MDLDLPSLVEHGPTITAASEDLNAAFALDPGEALAELSNVPIDPSGVSEFARRLAGSLRWLGPPQPGDLDEITAAVATAARWPDADERWMQLLLLEPALQSRAREGIGDADIAYAALLDLLLGAIPPDFDPELRQQLEAHRAAIPSTSPFEGRVEALKTTLLGP